MSDNLYENKFEYGIIRRKGPRDNQTDCEADVVLIHIPSKTIKRFHGTWWDSNFEKSINEWILSFPKSKEGITIDVLNYYYTQSVMDFLDNGV